MLPVSLSALFQHLSGADVLLAVLQYALTLEHLEDTFYRQALSKYSAKDFTNAGYDSSVRSRIEMVSADEQSHVAFCKPSAFISPSTIIDDSP